MNAAEVNATAEAGKQPLGEMPLEVLTRGNFGQPEAAAQWKRIQATLLSLSGNSAQVGAEKSSHLIHLHQPELVIDAIRSVVQAVRNHSKLRAVSEKWSTPIIANSPTSAYQLPRVVLLVKDWLVCLLTARRVIRRSWHNSWKATGFPFNAGLFCSQRSSRDKINQRGHVEQNLWRADPSTN